MKEAPRESSFETGDFPQITPEVRERFGMIEQEFRGKGGEGILSRLNNRKVRSIVGGGLLALSTLAAYPKESEAKDNDWLWGFFTGVVVDSITSSIAEGWLKESYPEREIVERLGGAINQYKQARARLEIVIKEVAEREGKLPDLKNRAGKAEQEKAKGNVISRLGYSEEMVALTRFEEEIKKLKAEQAGLQKRIVQLGSVIDTVHKMSNLEAGK